MSRLKGQNTEVGLLELAALLEQFGRNNPGIQLVADGVSEREDAYICQSCHNSPSALVEAGECGRRARNPVVA